ncbi:MAG: DUF4957 domain-containing protein [Chitinophagaceae bacterium]|nr:MAG: DUF4957 domain-containing protein [Chitinophagaceae bacterium]
MNINSHKKIINMRLFQNIKFTALAAIIVIIWLGACKKSEDLKPFVPERVFTPTAVSVAGGDTVGSVSWKASLFSTGQKVNYTVEVYDNKLFTGTAAYTESTDSLNIKVNDSKLQVRKYYWARVKANATANSQASIGWGVSIDSFRLTGEQLFLSVNEDLLTESSVQLRWKPAPDFTKIVLTRTGGTATDYTLSAGEITAAQKTITGLTPSSVYTAEIFKGAASKGIISFTTRSPVPTGANVVTVGPTDDLAALLAAAAPNAVFVLAQGSLHKADAEVILPANASFSIWGHYGPNRAVIAFNGLRLPTTAGNIRFENVDITGYQNNDVAGTKRNYIFNQSAATTTESIVFENSIIRNLVNTPIRLQTAAGQTINNFTFNKCQIFDIGNNGANGTYALIHSNVATGKINNIRITNSTAYDIGYGVILHNAAPSTLVLISNSTFENTTGNGRYFIDYNTQTAGSITLTNVIVGKTLSPAAIPA